MFSKVKCPNCGAKNSKERMVCIECGSSLTSEQVERQLSQVSTEAKVPDKTVIEKEIEAKIEDEYRDNEKVLFKTEGYLILPRSKHDGLYRKREMAYCFVTERYVVIEAEETTKIPLSCIQDCRLSYGTEAGFEFGFGPCVIATLTFVDDTNKKYELSFEMYDMANGGNFKRALAKHLEFPMSSL